MCGICGIVSLIDKENTSDLFRGAVSLMNNAIAHRGPDDEGYFNDDKISFGHRRLSIIDLSKNGHQPMLSADGRYVIIYNGELYNYKTLKLELQRAKVGDTASAYPFSTQSDTEVIIAAYIKWGKDCLKYLNGMYAFALWDKEKKELFIARDRLGIKPLYYYQDKKSLVFASELRALLKSGLVPKKLDRKAVCDYIEFQTVHAPSTIISNVKMLLPGHYIFLREGDEKVKQVKYWALQDAPVQTEAKPYEQVCKDIKDLFFASVERRLVADVPFGAFLSGGIDSSLVVAVMSQLMREKVRTFSVTFDESEFSEAPYSTQVAKQYNTEHHDIRLSEKECLSKLPSILASMDHPSGDGINTYIVSEATKREGIKMALSGLGSDELFAGYPLFKRLYKLEKYKWVSGFPEPLISIPAKILNHIKPTPASAKLLEMTETPNWRLENTYPIAREAFTYDELELLVNDYHGLERKLSLNKNHGILSQISVAELGNYLPDVLLRDTDQMSMAHALEVRVPFLDYQLVEYVLGLNDEIKFPTTPKKLLTDAMTGLLPVNITGRKKMGFTFPWNTWMKSELKSFCKANIDSLSEREFINKTGIQRLWDDFIKGKPQSTWYKLWHLVALENWIKENGIDE